MTHASFVHLRVHTAYSLAEGALKIGPLTAQLQSQHMPAVAITDTNNMFGALEFAMAAAGAGIQPIMGLQANLKYDQTGFGKVVLLAKDEAGYQNLVKLASAIHVEQHSGLSLHVDCQNLMDHQAGLILLTGGHEGPWGQLLLNNKKEAAGELLESVHKVFQDRLYIEIMRHGLPAQQQTEPVFLEWAQAYNIPIVATNDVYFSDPSMYEAHDALLCIAEGRYVLEEDRRRVTKNHYLKTAEEMQTLFQDLPEALENTLKIAQRCSFMPEPRKPMLPAYESPSGKTEAEELRIQAREGLAMRLQDNSGADIEVYQKRLEYELDVIIQMGFPGYFLIVSDFIKWAKSHGIPVGPGRGSGAGSVVAWSLTITDMDPIAFGLIFERFLNPERVSMPDFDIDFCQDRRDEVINYVQQRYGVDRVAQIITFGKLQARAVLRDVGRVLQVPYPVVDKISKLVPNNPANPCTLEEALTKEPELAKIRSTDSQIAHLIDLAIKLEGLYRHASTHAAGIIIGDRNLREVVPLYRDPKSPMLATQFSMKYVELAGLVKFDFLGLKTLTILECAADMARSRGSDVHISKLPLDDPKTFELLNRVETLGVFQIEGQGMSEVLRKLKPDHFEELIDLNALYRPGPMDDIPRYLACKHGEQAVSYAHPLLEAILQPTFGVMVYQEQVMKIAQELGGYSLGKADLLRRAMGKKIKKEMDDQRAIFLEGAKQKDIDADTAVVIFDQMAKFAGYGFNKSHSAPYALVTYQTAYMKANYPAEFMAATMTYDMLNTDKLYDYCQELQRMGIPLLLPNINKSMSKFSVEEDSKTGKLAIRYGLAALKNVGVQAMEEIVAERQGQGPFKDLADLLSRVPGKALNKRQLESLISTGALDGLSANRATLYESIDQILKYVTIVQEDKKSSQVNLFGGTQESLPPLRLKEHMWSNQEALQKEFEAFGFYLSAHPLQEYQKTLDKYNVLPAAKLKEYAGSAAHMAGIVSDIKKKISRTGKRFAYVTLSDHSGSYEVMMFEEILLASTDLLSSGKPLLLNVGMRKDDEGNVRLSCNGIKELAQHLDNNLEIHMNTSVDIQTLQAALPPKETGKQKVYVCVQMEDQKMICILLDKKYDLTPSTRDALSKMPGILEVKEI
jgi:DNA polymerase III subunit alpha